MAKFGAKWCRVYTSCNTADTSRDPDNYEYKDIAHVKTIKRAKEIAYEYIQEHFSKKQSKLYRQEDGTLRAMDFCSYPTTIIIERY